MIKNEKYSQDMDKKIDEVCEKLREQYGDEEVVKEKINLMLANGTWDVIKIMTLVTSECEIDGLPTKLVYNDFCKLAYAMGIKSVVNFNTFSKTVVKYFPYFTHDQRVNKEKTIVFVRKIIE